MNNPFPFALIVGLLTFIALQLVSHSKKLENLDQAICTPEAGKCEKAKQP